MAQDYGAAQPIYDVAKKGYDKVVGVFGDRSKSAEKKPDAMQSVPKGNTNRKSWEDATKFTGPDKAPEPKAVTTQKTTATKKAPPKSTARKSLALKK